jgi:hypothetical protein
MMGRVARRARLPSGAEVTFVEGFGRFRHSELGPMQNVRTRLQALVPIDAAVTAQSKAETLGVSVSEVQRRFEHVRFLSNPIRERLFAKLQGLPTPLQPNIRKDDIEPFSDAIIATDAQIKSIYNVLATHICVCSETHRVATWADLVLEHKKTKRLRVCNVRVAGSPSSRFAFSQITQCCAPPLAHLECSSRTRSAVHNAVVAVVLSREGYVPFLFGRDKAVQLQASEQALSAPSLAGSPVGIDIGEIVIGPGALEPVEAIMRHQSYEALTSLDSTCHRAATVEALVDSVLSLSDHDALGIAST